jgi:hypothetical protein
MADHYLAVADISTQGFKNSDFLTGVANTVGVNPVEFRVQDGTTITTMQVVTILQAFIRFFENRAQSGGSGFNVNL